MLSPEHETPLALTELDPTLVTWLVTMIGDRSIKPHATVRSVPTESRILRPTTLHADAVVMISDANNEPVQAVVLEIQRRWEPDKGTGLAALCCPSTSGSQGPGDPVDLLS